MKPDTLAFIETLFEWYGQTSAGREPENAKALEEAWDDMTVYRHQKDKERIIIEKMKAVMVNEPHIGLWELGATFAEILATNT